MLSKISVTKYFMHYFQNMSGDGASLFSQTPDPQFAHPAGTHDTYIVTQYFSVYASLVLYLGCFFSLGFRSCALSSPQLSCSEQLL